MILTKKDFIKSLCKQHAFDKTFVTTIVDKYEQWMKDSMLEGHDIRLPMGKLCVIENSYHATGVNPKGSNFHYHAYRPRFAFLQKFKTEMDRREAEIRKNKNG